MGKRVCPLGTWSFRVRLGGNHAPARAPAAALAPELGLGLEFGNPTWSGSKRTGPHGYGVIADRAHSAIWTRATTERKPHTNHCNGLCGFCLERSVTIVQTEPLQPFGLQNTILPFLKRYK